MKRIHSAKFTQAAILALLCLMTTPGYAAKYPNYYSAKEALANNDCASAVDYLNAFKAENGDLLEANKGFAGRVDSQIEACQEGSGGGVSGVTDDPDAFGDEKASVPDILPDHPPD